ncbi:MAG: hypothetical protein E4H33_02350 [Anaerolineales bacterium]|nr:MAG: hypothetical protein E4H33_02350 [Anaerolineales bacterium]
MRRTVLIWAAVMLIIILGLVGCNFSGESGPLTLEEAVHAGVQATLTKDAWLDGVESARKTAIAAENSSDGSDNSGENPTANPAVATPRPTLEPTLTPTLKPASGHLISPGKIKERVDSYLVDYNSSDYAEEGVTYGDQYKANILERPFTSEDMVYQGNIDIIRVNLKVMDTWAYAIIYLANDLPSTGTMRYGMELDLDENGRGDYLIRSYLPTSTEWSVSGVQVFYDLDGDVGSTRPMVNDPPDQSLNGYEVLLFDSGEGEDPDLVWVRRNPDELNSLQIAYKNDLIGMTGYLWSAWADDGLKAPDYRDYNDRFTEESAGSPYPGSPLYPIKSVYLVDTTCRSYFGFTPTGNEPGLCP